MIASVVRILQSLTLVLTQVRAIVLVLSKVVPAQEMVLHVA